jgi:hypothetical protein
MTRLVYVLTTGALVVALILPDPAAAGGPLTGRATWYRAPLGRFAAGPLLRRALGPSWRGRYVQVCSGDRCVTGRLLDWCACTTGRRLVDLPAGDFARLGRLSAGVLPVVVTWQR